MPQAIKDASKWIAVAATGVQVAIAIGLYKGFDTTTTAVQFAEKHDWIPSYHITYFMGVDGISHVHTLAAKRRCNLLQARVDAEGDARCSLGAREGGC